MTQNKLFWRIRGAGLGTGKIVRFEMRFLFVALAILPVWSQTSDWQSGVAEVSAKEKSPGSGFVVAVRSGRAYIVTCAHVVEGDAKPVVTFHVAPEERYSAVVRHLQGGRMDGLALLVVDKPPANVRALEAGTNSAKPETPVMVAGYPSSVGGFTVLHTSIASIQGTELYLERDTEEGFSGGPIVLAGRVAGMVFGHGGGYGRSVPVAIIDVYLRGLDVRWGPSGPAASKAREDAKDGLKYVWIPAGKFTMGCSPGDTECVPDEIPPHAVEITRGFWIGETEVTQAAYRKVIKTNPSRFKSADRPVENVSWDEAKAYCEAVGLRLPTEAEWEYVARAGSKDSRYGELDEIAWHGGNSESQTQPVAAKSPNAWGLYDMLGNVWEWTGTGTTKITTSKKFRKIPRVRVRPPVREWYAGARGTPILCTSASRTVTGRGRRSGSAISGFVVPGNCRESFGVPPGHHRFGVEGFSCVGSDE